MLIGLPLVFELLLVSTLMYLANEYRSAEQEQSRRKDVVSAATMTAKCTYDACADLNSYRAVSSSETIQKFEKDCNLAEENVGLLVALTEDDAQIKPVAAEMEKYTHKQVRALRKVKDLVDQGDMVTITLVANEFVNRHGGFLTEIAQNLERVVAYEESEIARFGQQDREWMMFVMALIGGVALSVAFAGGLAIAVNRDLISRLSVLMDNSRRVAKRAPLNPPLTGTDEIADVDRVFHDMATTLAETDKQRAEMEKLKQEFMSMVSHDLRSPLTSLQVFFDLIRDGAYGDLNNQGLERLERAKDSTSRLIKLINDLLDAEKLEAGKLTVLRDKVNYDEVIDQAVEDLRGMAEQHGVKLSARRAFIEINADRDRLIQVLVNLISNAIKFSPPGAEIEVSAQVSDRSLVTRVKDQGRGVPDKYKESIFERYKQVKRSDQIKKGGTGLGLAICKAIVEEHGGKVGVDSEEGKGSTFWFSIPLSDAELNAFAATEEV